MKKSLLKTASLLVSVTKKHQLTTENSEFI